LEEAGSVAGFFSTDGARHDPVAVGVAIVGAAPAGKTGIKMPETV